MSAPKTLEALIAEVRATLPDPVQFAAVPCTSCGELGILATCETCVARVKAAKELRERQIRNACFPPRYAWADSGAPELAYRVRESSAGNAAQTLAAMSGNRQPTITLAGGAGCGKTSLAVAFAMTQRRPFFAAVAGMERALQAAISADRDEARRVHDKIDYARTCGVLVLDDLGKEAGTKLSPVRDILHHRHESELLTVVTTGQSERQICERYDEGTERRLFEDSSALVIRWRT